MTPDAITPSDVRFATARLYVPRRWRPADLDAYAAVNADPEVMRYLNGPMSRAESDDFARYGEAWVDTAGLGLLPVVRAQDDVTLGMCGLHRHRWYPDEVEVGWRLARSAWGHGYATEAAVGWLREAFGPLGLDHVISTTTPDNLRSQAVMRRLGLTLREQGTGTRADGSVIPVVVFTVDRATWLRRMSGNGTGVTG